MHIEIQHFIKNSMLIKCNRILYTTTTRSLNFCGCDVNQNYLQHDNVHTNIEYNAKNIDQILSENLSTIDHITIGTLITTQLKLMTPIMKTKKMNINVKIIS